MCCVEFPFESSFQTSEPHMKSTDGPTCQNTREMKALLRFIMKSINVELLAERVMSDSKTHKSKSHKVEQNK